ncbi:hypothetical protein J6590_105139, partial [Homalodisca vitripennis]
FRWAVPLPHHVPPAGLSGHSCRHGGAAQNSQVPDTRQSSPVHQDSNVSHAQDL